ncbi:hypothetical protein [Helicobacter sp.]|uniref:hypothetical protein n=1 Tax=Helicobacter sp. TaxID=218 RepID=UPI0025C098FA|nr:hypothetical protein [Helicobacter sp.]MCI5633331.1 hypothetical protein [Helicobacter sp.]
MQISTNPTMRETSLLYQTTQKQQGNAVSFDTLLSMQNNQNQADNQESQKANVSSLSEFSVSWDSEEG